MNNKHQSIRVGLFFILGLALAWITFESLSGGGGFKKQGYTLVAPFASLKGLKTGDDVLMAGVKIGSVKDTRLGNKRVEAVLAIDPKVQIPVDAVASVQTSSLLGSQHLAVSFGESATMLQPNAELKTLPTVDLNEVIAKLGSVGNKLEELLGTFTGGGAGGTGGGPGGLFQKLDTLVTENGPKLSETLANLQEISGKIKSGEGTLGKLINDPKLHDELLAGVSEIKLAAADARTFMSDTKGIVADVKAGKGTIGMLLYDEATADSVKVTAKNLRELSEKLNGGQGTLGKLISDDSLYVEVQGIVKKADRALEGLGDQGPITAVGVVAGALF
ncbi:MlaD family protein [Oleiharenicola lentus]|uniref:MlaD family protein n=1 Tax=Oleiharenicola lentus TaxID=2508720 RepID=UPI003F673C4F